MTFTPEVNWCRARGVECEVVLSIAEAVVSFALHDSENLLRLVATQPISSGAGCFRFSILQN